MNNEYDKTGFYFDKNGTRIREDYGIPTDEIAIGQQGFQNPEKTGFYFDKDGTRIREDYGIPTDEIAKGILRNPISIDGKIINIEIDKIINNRKLTPETIKPEERKLVFADILSGKTNDTELLAKKIDLIINDTELIQKMIIAQYNEALNEIKDEKLNLNNDLKDRQFQFLATIKILIEKGYNIENLQLQNEKTLPELIANFRKKTTNSSKKINTPTWFKDPQEKNEYHKKNAQKLNDPYLFAGLLIREIYAKYPEIFTNAYEVYKTKSNLLSFEEFMHYAFTIDTKTISLEKFKEERNKQLLIDKNEREKQINQTIIQEDIKGGHKSR